MAFFPRGSETAARVAAEVKAEAGAKVLKEKEAAVGRVDHLTRQAEAQADSYDALVSARQIKTRPDCSCFSETRQRYIM